MHAFADILLDAAGEADLVVGDVAGKGGRSHDDITHAGNRRFFGIDGIDIVPVIRLRFINADDIRPGFNFRSGRFYLLYIGCIRIVYPRRDVGNRVAAVIQPLIGEADRIAACRRRDSDAIAVGDRFIACGIGSGDTLHIDIFGETNIQITIAIRDHADIVFRQFIDVVDATGNTHCRTKRTIRIRTNIALESERFIYSGIQAIQGIANIIVSFVATASRIAISQIIRRRFERTIRIDSGTTPQSICRTFQLADINGIFIVSTIGDIGNFLVTSINTVIFINNNTADGNLVEFHIIFGGVGDFAVGFLLDLHVFTGNHFHGIVGIDDFISGRCSVFLTSICRGFQSKAAVIDCIDYILRSCQLLAVTCCCRFVTCGGNSRSICRYFISRTAIRVLGFSHFDAVAFYHFGFGRISRFLQLTDIYRISIRFTRFNVGDFLTARINTSFGNTGATVNFQTIVVDGSISGLDAVHIQITIQSYLNAISICFGLNIAISGNRNLVSQFFHAGCAAVTSKSQSFIGNRIMCIYTFFDIVFNFLVKPYLIIGSMICPLHLLNDCFIGDTTNSRLLGMNFIFHTTRSIDTGFYSNVISRDHTTMFACLCLHRIELVFIYRISAIYTRRDIGNGFFACVDALIGNTRAIIYSQPAVIHCGVASSYACKTRRCRKI